MKYYHRMLRVFLSISITCTLIIVILFIASYYMLVQRDFRANADAIARRVSEYTDVRFQSVYEIPMLIRFTNYTNRYMSEKLDSPDRYSRLMLHYFIKNIYATTHTRMQYLAMSKLNDNYVIMNDITGNLELLKNRMYLDNSGLESVSDAFQKEPELPFHLSKNDDGNGNVTYTLAKREWANRLIPLYVFLQFDEEQLFDLNQIEGATLAVLYQGQLLASTGVLHGDELIHALENKEASKLYTQVIESSVPSIEYIYMSAPPRFISSVPVILILAIGFLALVLIILSMYRLTKNMYHPIEQVLKSLDDSPPTGDEFYYIQNRFRKLRDHMDEMILSLSNYSDIAKDRLFHDILTGLLTQDEAKEKLSELQISAASGTYTVVLIQYNETDELVNRNTYDQISATKDILLTAVSSMLSLFTDVGINYNLQGLIFCGDLPDQDSSQLRHVLLTVEPEHGLEITAFIGDPCRGLENIHSSYRTAFRMINHPLAHTTKSKVVRSDHFKDTLQQPHRVYYPLSLEQSLINAVMNNKEKLWRSTIVEITEANRDLVELHHISLMLTTTVNRIIDMTNHSISEFFPEDMIVYLEFRGCKSMSAIEEKAYSLLMVLAEKIESFKQKTGEDLEERMKEFLHQNYHKNISLYDLAEHMNMSRNYMSTLFKNSTGHNFKDYLARYRYDMACALLQKNPRMKIREAAELVGSNSEALGRVFLRYGGITPSEYVERLNKDRISH